MTCPIYSDLLCQILRPKHGWRSMWIQCLASQTLFASPGQHAHGSWRPLLFLCNGALCCLAHCLRTLRLQRAVYELNVLLISFLDCVTLLCLDLIILLQLRDLGDSARLCRECEDEATELKGQKSLPFGKAEKAEASSGLGRHAFYRAHKLQKVSIF